MPWEQIVRGAAAVALVGFWLWVLPRLGKGG
jgi:hypothetical protein